MNCYAELYETTCSNGDTVRISWNYKTGNVKVETLTENDDGREKMDSGRASRTRRAHDAS